MNRSIHTWLSGGWRQSEVKSRGKVARDVRIGCTARWKDRSLTPGGSEKARRQRLLGPSVADEVLGLELGGIDHDVTDLLTLPGVGDVNEAIAGLDDGRVRVFTGLGF